MSPESLKGLEILRHSWKWLSETTHGKSRGSVYGRGISFGNGENSGLNVHQILASGWECARRTKCSFSYLKSEVEIY